MNVRAGTITVEADVHFSNGHKGRKRLATGKKPVPPPVPSSAVPRLSRLMALAIRFDRLIREGAVKDYAELARLGGVTRARLTQIMNLLNLAPDIQEEILFLPPVAGEREAISERRVREIGATTDWHRQRKAWRLAVRRGRMIGKQPAGEAYSPANRWETNHGED
jgi:hypothetical protein